MAAALAAGCGGDEEPAAEPAEPAATEPAEPAEPAETAEAPAEEPAEEPAEGGAEAGGVYRVDWETSFDFTSGFDPVGEYLGEAWGIMSNLLVRTLVGYRHVPGAAGNEVIPDLATDLGQVSADGLTYTFTLKDGIMFGPPVSREIVAEDVVYAFERIGTDALVAQYGFYYDGVIEGMAEFRAGEADTISGVTAVDDKTVEFKLTQPTGDFLYRIAMPATAPVPREVASCFTEANLYGRYLVSSGPYMIEGSDAQDATSCDTLQPLSGFDPDTSLTLVRNPDYDPATDTTEARENLPDGFELPDQLERRRHLQQDRRGRDRRRHRQRAAGGAPRVLAGRGAPAVPARQRRRPHVVHHDEPHSAAVRRHPRPQGRELRHGQGGPAPRVGRPAVRRDREPHRPRRRCSTTLSPTTCPTRARATPATPPRPWRR